MSVTITTTVRIETPEGEVLERTLVHDAGTNQQWIWHETRLALDAVQTDLHAVVNAAFKDRVKITKA
ncbi:hypothetical protein [Oerskovia paurometabola]|uniref:hypothetical protein n=1 Tax=Oerskovia paurometabola TaxID=162170 RepID=UPI0037F3258D